MKFDKHGNGNGLDDLYVLPETDKERDKIIAYLKSINHSYEWSFSNVEGQDWYGKRFLDIPFGECLREEIATLTKTKEEGK